MANQEHLGIFMQGVETWKQWRQDSPEIQPDLSKAELDKADLHGIDLHGADLHRANLSLAYLNGADLNETNLSFAHLDEAHLNGAHLMKANLGFARLNGADLDGARLDGADLGGANLSFARLSFVSLNGANFEDATVGWTVFGDLDLRKVKGLETLHHEGPSTIGTDTISRSQGDLPETFLRGAGLSDAFITYARALAQHPIEYYTCFLSYSSHDQAFAERLYADLQSKGVRCWFAPEHMKIGEKIRHRIEESIRIYDKLLIVLSAHSMKSEWVEHEVEAALDKEQEGKPAVLFPIRLDETIMHSRTGWAAHIQRTRHIGDFTKWETYKDYQQALERLLRDLKAEGNK